MTAGPRVLAPSRQPAVAFPEFTGRPLPSFSRTSNSSAIKIGRAMAVALPGSRFHLGHACAKAAPQSPNGAHPSDAPISLEMVASELINALCRRKSTSSWR